MKNILGNAKKTLILFSIFLGLQSAVAQITVTGTVNDETGTPLPGVTVIEKGTTNGLSTDFDGNYTITVSGPNSTLVFSYIGYLSQEVALNGRNSVTISLEVDTQRLDEVVIIGYGAQKKSSLTGAVAIVDTEETEKSQYTNITDRLQGRVAGVSVSAGGDPGNIGNISIRGSVFFENNDPLYVVDGVVVNQAPIINPNDVESIQILKDASSSSIYGSRAANGVILITTKKGRKGKLTTNVNVNTGFQNIARTVDVTNASEYIRIVRAGFENNGNLDEAPALVLNPDGTDTDWQDEVYRTGVLRDISASVSGGGENFNVFFGVNNTNQTGVIRDGRFDRSGIRLNSSFQIFEGLSVGQNLALNRTRDKATPQSAFFVDAISPLIPVFDPTKTAGFGHSDSQTLGFTTNPIGEAALFNDVTESQNILGNVYLDYEFVDDLTYHFSLGIDNTTGERRALNRRGQIRRQQPFNSALTIANDKVETTYIEHRLNYNKTFGKHGFSALAAYNDQEDTGLIETIAYDQTQAAFENGLFEISAADPSAVPILSSNRFTRVIRSFLGRVTYEYDNRYFFKASARNDSFSGFLGNNRDQTFSSVDVAWNVANESFFNVDWISQLKFRAAYGENGFNEADDNPYIFVSNILRGTAENGANPLFGPNSTQATGGTRADLGNPDLGWATLKEYNFGLDASLFNGKIIIDANYYFGDVEGVLADVPVPGTTGLNDPDATIRLNAVDNERSGWEASVTYRKNEGEFQYSIGANAFSNNTKVVRVPDGFTGIVGNSITQVGQTRAQLFLIDYQGVYTAEQISALPAGFTVFGRAPEVGDANYVDINGDNQINEQDRTVVGDVLADVEFGLNFTANYKNWDFTTFFSGLVGRDVYNGPRQALIASIADNFPADYNPIIDGVGTDPTPQASTGHGNNQPSSQFVEDGSFVKLRNLQIGYTIPWEGVDNLRVYLSGQNLFTISGYKGTDPEFTGGFFTSGEDNQFTTPDGFGAAAIGVGERPEAFRGIRTISFGLNLSL
ncbi:MAG: SusC/RagA family TonB-linked outer membrane protein [Bacteroidota bacterium]